MLSDRLLSEESESLSPKDQAPAEHKKGTSSTNGEFSLYPFINTKDWTQISHLIHLKRITSVHLSERQSTQKEDEQNVVYHLFHHGKANLVLELINSDLITPDLLASQPGSHYWGMLGSLIYTMCQSPNFLYTMIIEQCIIKCLITPATLSAEGYESAYDHMQTVSSEALKTKFNAYCERELEKSLKSKEYEQSQEWLDLMAARMNLTTLVKSINALFDAPSFSAFDEQFKILMKYVLLSSADNTSKQNVIRHFIFKKIEDATSQSQLRDIKVKVFNNENLKRLFATSFMFSTNYAQFEALKRKITELSNAKVFDAQAANSSPQLRLSPTDNTTT